MNVASNTTFKDMMGDMIFNKKKARSRIQSTDDEIITAKIGALPVLPEQWKDEKFENEDERIGSFLEHLHRDSEH